MEQNRDFVLALTQQILQNAHSFQEKNTDYDAYPSHVAFLIRITNQLRSLLYKKGICINLELGPYKASIARLAFQPDDLRGLIELYELLENPDSRELLVQLMAYRILGRDRVRLPLNTESFWEKRKFLKSLLDQKNTIRANFAGWKLAYVDLAQIGYPIKLYYSASGIHNLFELKQYEYHQSNPSIKAMEGDVVIDAGGCWGDTALYFANEVGSTGKVFTFEFLPDNLRIMKKNLALNPELRDRIDVIENPLWDKSGEIVYCKGNGPASRVSFEKVSGADVVVQTIAIDDFLQQRQIERIDFIKMDIEGAELSALKGAIKAIERSRPKLAISLYHSMRDFVTIPRFLKSLGLNYEFYLGHYTIYAGETVLFAVPGE